MAALFGPVKGSMAKMHAAAINATVRCSMKILQSTINEIELRTRRKRSIQFQESQRQSGSGSIFAVGQRGSLSMRQTQSRQRAETLDYLHAMLGQLRAMAEAERFDMLTYLIEMAYVEASQIISSERPARGRQEKRRDVA